jgi:hypothetical protein
MTSRTPDFPDISTAFEAFMNSRNDAHPLRYQFWLAFAAGADYALNRMALSPTETTRPVFDHTVTKRAKP